MTKDEITVDGNTYILKTEHEKRLKKAEEKATKASTHHPKLTLTEFHTDPSFTYGIGSVKLCGDWVRSRFSLDLLKKAIKVLEAVEQDTVDIVFTKDHPVILGKLNKGRQTISGVIIAPRVEDDK